MKTNFILALLLGLSFAAQAQMRYFYANLQGSQQVPANASAGSGVVVIRYNTADRMLYLNGDYQDLTTAATVSHIHGPAAPGSNAPVLFPLDNTGGTTGVLSGTATLTPAQETDLFAGNYYVNVHTPTYPGGEIRGQIIATSTTETEFYNGRLQGAQQVPPNGSTGSGSFQVLLDKAANTVYVTGNFSGLAADATASHIHREAANVNGPVIINFSVTHATSGTIHVISPITATDEDAMIARNTYINIHNAPFPGGEIRGQITRLSQYSFFKANLQGSQQVPANASTGVGTVIVKYNNETSELDLVGDYQNLTTAATISHIHGPAATGANAPVLINLDNTGGTSGVLSGTATLTPLQESYLFDGLLYVNVHNSTYPGGEIRGQLSGTSSGETQFFTGLLQGAQQVPANGSTATGRVTVILDKLTREVYLTGNFSGLSTPASAGHIHRQPAGVNGPVVVPLSVTAAVSGTITGNAVVRQSFADSMIMGYTYVNIHNAEFPGGEIRAQLGDQVLPLRLTYFNGFKERNNVVLVWESAQETNLQQYEVEQQDNVTRKWILKGSVKATNSLAASKYRLADVPLSSSDGFVVYRLKMVDKNGSVTYSNVIRLNFAKAAASLSILSNPVVNGMLHYTVTGLSSDKKVEFSIINYNGKLVARGTQNALSNNQVDVSHLAAGMYKLVLRIDGEMLQQSFVK